MPEQGGSLRESTEQSECRAHLEASLRDRGHEWLLCMFAPELAGSGMTALSDNSEVAAVSLTMVGGSARVPEFLVCSNVESGL